MNNINYTDLLLLPAEEEYSTFDFNGSTIEVLNHLPAKDKYDLVAITLQKSAEGGVYNPVKLDMVFHLNLVYLYTNIQFSDEDREDEYELYDKLSTSGLLDIIIATINEEEYKEMQAAIDTLVDWNMTFNRSAAGVLRGFTDDLAPNAEAAAKIVESFDPSQYQAVIDFAEAANGGRPISGPNKNKTVEVE